MNCETRRTVYALPRDVHRGLFRFFFIVTFVERVPDIPGHIGQAAILRIVRRIGQYLHCHGMSITAACSDSCLFYKLFERVSDIPGGVGGGIQAARIWIVKRLESTCIAKGCQSPRLIQILVYSTELLKACQTFLDTSVGDYKPQ